jgi:hypothetical protein
MLNLQPSTLKVSTDFRARHHCDFWQTTRTAPAAAGGLL